ncbi:MAG: TetR/AcrR family transcriptional regulator, partial [Chloroflexota bacterium]
LSTAEVAKQAGVSVGTLYQFFDNKDDLMEAIAEAHIDDLQQYQSEFLGPDSIYVPPHILVDRMLDWLVSHNKRFPTFHPLFTGAWQDKAFTSVMDSGLEEIVLGVSLILRHHGPHLSEETAKLGATVLISVAKGMFLMLENAPEAAHDAIVAETKRLCLLYFNDLIAENVLEDK